jgi:hypothetical protein
MTAMQPMPQQRTRTNLALLLMLVLGNLFFFWCVAGRYAAPPVEWGRGAGQPERIVLTGD